MKRALVILNPAAGNRASGAVREALGRHFRDAGISCEVRETARGEGIGIAVRARAREGWDLVVAAGGDGTVSGTVDGLAGSAIPLGIIPTGTANLLARELNIPLETDAAVSLIARSPASRKIDAMRIGGRVYVLLAGVGISASVAGGTTRANKNRFGLLAYVGAAFLKMFEFRPRRLEISVDGATSTARAVEVAVSNSGILATMIFPKGRGILVDDGRLDVWILTSKTLLDYPRYLLRVLAGRPATPRILCLSAGNRVSIRSGRPLPVQADGDVIGTTPVEIEVLPRAVNVIVPERAAVEPGLTLARDIFLAQYLPDFKKFGGRASATLQAARRARPR